MIKQKPIEVKRGDFKIETGRLARQADGACVVSFGDTRVLVTVVRDEAEDIDYFPLIVDYEEKFYAGGRIPGGFIKREGKPSNEAILNARMIDRPIRPCFPDNYQEKVQIVVTVLSADKDFPPEIAGMLGASSALMISPIPYLEPVAGVRVGRSDGEFVVNPPAQVFEESDINIVVAGTADAVTMVEGSMNELSEAEVIQAIQLAKDRLDELIDLQKEFADKCAIDKIEVPEASEVEYYHSKLEFTSEDLQGIKKADNKSDRQGITDSLRKSKIKQVLESEGLTDPTDEDFIKAEKTLSEVFDEQYKKLMRKHIITDKERIDKRMPDQLRSVTCEVGILPRVHGSALFTRGETQSLGTATLGTTEQDEQIIDQMIRQGRKRFMLHYNFPSFSVGETGYMGPPKRREIGHGHLAESALISVLPTEDEFPYIIRMVSEILESNGSSSMASVCSASLALMDAGIPIKKPVAGVAIGLVEEADRYELLTDIQGIEDHFGDMDFKVAGTRDGICALQLDVKAGGISAEIMKKALHRAKEARYEILDRMKEALEEPRSTLSPHAPVLEVMEIDEEKIGSVIGPGGKIIRKIIDETNTEIDIDDEGKVKIAGPFKEEVQKAKEMIEELTEEVEVGKRYKGVVTRIENYGAFVEIKRGATGMIHISDLAEGYVESVKDIVQMGEEITVEVTEIDEMGRINLRKVPEESDKKIQVGETLLGKVKNTTDFGAFVEAEKDGVNITGLIHISELSDGYVRKVEDVVKPGDQVAVKVIRIDDKGKYFFRKIPREDVKFDKM